MFAEVEPSFDTEEMLSVISTSDLQDRLSDLGMLMVGPTGDLNDEPSDTTVVPTGD